MAGETARPLLEVEGLRKSFFATRAAYDVTFDVHEREIVSLLGENGAGKSTVIKMLAGVYKPDAGTIALEGRELRTADSREGKISFVHQTLGLIDWMTVAENIAQVTGYPKARGFISARRMRRSAEEVLSSVGGQIDPDMRVFNLTRTERNLLAIARALATNPRVLVLDEPTASLPAKDVDRLFEVLSGLRNTGVGMIYVSHRLDEIYRISSRAIIMRNGTIVGDRDVSDLPHRELVGLIAGSKHRTIHFEPPSTQDRLEVQGLEVSGTGPVSFSVHRGEVVALCGLRGAGQEDVGRALAGAEPPASGSVILDGERVRLSNPAHAISAGIGFSTSNRETDAVAPGLTARENLFLNPFVWGWRQWQFSTAKVERRRAVALFKEFGVRPADPEISLDTFSGGNQQKVLLARWLGVGRRLLVLEEPTMGVDVGAKSDIYALLGNVAREGTAVLVISTDMEEVATVSHRALVFSRGKVSKELKGASLTTPNLIAAASELDQPQLLEGGI